MQEISHEIEHSDPDVELYFEAYRLINKSEMREEHAIG